MILNPEFRRNLWLEFSPQRLVLTPLIIGAILYLGHISPLYSASNAAYSIFLFFVYIWGTKAASESIPDEFNNHTWDNQRLSTLRPWTLTWGKLFGATAYTWYGAFIALAAYLALNKGFSNNLVLGHVFILLLGGLLAHTSALLISMNALQAESNTRVNNFSYLLFGLFISYFFTSNVLTVLPLAGTSYSFYGFSLTQKAFYFYSLCAFLAWAILGLYRRMQASLQYAQLPWAWLLFSLFCVAYFTNFFTLDSATYQELAKHRDLTIENFYLKFKLSYYASLWIASILTYVALFSDKINLATYKKIMAKGFKRASIPYWIASFVVLLGVAIWIGVSSPLSVTLNEGLVFIQPVFLISYVLFVIRDILIIHYCKFSDRPKRSSSTALFYLIVLYGLVPSILFTMQSSSELLHFFLPSSAKYWIISILAPASEVLIMGWLLMRKIGNPAKLENAQLLEIKE